MYLPLLLVAYFVTVPLTFRCLLVNERFESRMEQRGVDPYKVPSRTRRALYGWLALLGLETLLLTGYLEAMTF